MGETKFRVGDKVKFKSWQEMEEEFGLDDDGDIDIPFSFTSEMENVLDKERTYTVSKINGDIVCLQENSEYYYSTDMFHLVQLDDRVTTLYRDIDILSKYQQMSQNSVSVFFDDSMLQNIYSILLKIMLIDEEDLNVYVMDINKSITLKELRSAVERNSFANKKAVYFFSSEDITEDITEYQNALVTKDDKNDPKTLEKVLNFLVPESPYKDLLFKADFSALTEILDEKERTFKEERRKRKNKEAIEKFSKEIQEAAVEKTTAELNAAKRAIDRLEEQYHIALSNLHEKEKELSWTTCSQASEEVKDFVSILNRDESLYEIAISYPCIYFRVIQPLLFVDSESYELYRKKGIIEKKCYDYETSLRIVDAIFRREITLIIDQSFYFNISDWECSRRSSLKDGEFGIPNPHISGYNCWGDNYPRIIKALKARDYVSAYSQAKSAIAGLNVDDSAVMNEFYSYLSRTTPFKKVKCIRIPETGELMTIKEAEEYLKAKDKEEGQSEEN